MPAFREMERCDCSVAQATIKKPPLPSVFRGRESERHEESLDVEDDVEISPLTKVGGFVVHKECSRQ